MKYKKITVVVAGEDPLANQTDTILKRTSGRKSFQVVASNEERPSFRTLSRLPGLLKEPYIRAELHALYLMVQTPSAHAALVLEWGHRSVGVVPPEQPYALGVLVSSTQGERGLKRLDNLIRLPMDYTKPWGKKTSLETFQTYRTTVLEQLVESWMTWMYQPKQGGIRAFLKKLNATK